MRQSGRNPRTFMADLQDVAIESRFPIDSILVFYVCHGERGRMPRESGIRRVKIVMAVIELGRFRPRARLGPGTSNGAAQPSRRPAPALRRRGQYPMPGP